MLAHPRVKFSTFPAELSVPGVARTCNEWLQCSPMRIELPTASWADTLPRADDDAHTMTVAAPTARDWADALFTMDTLQTLRTEIARVEPVPVTITF